MASTIKAATASLLTDECTEENVDPAADIFFGTFTQVLPSGQSGSVVRGELEFIVTPGKAIVVSTPETGSGSLSIVQSASVVRFSAVNPYRYSAGGFDGSFVGSGGANSLQGTFTANVVLVTFTPPPESRRLVVGPKKIEGVWEATAIQPSARGVRKSRAGFGSQQSGLLIQPARAALK